MIVQLCGLSGAGKTTLAREVQKMLAMHGVKSEIIDGDDYRQQLCRGLGFSQQDRMENIRRLGFVASKLSAHGIVALISAINPFEESRQEIHSLYSNVKTVYIDCPVPELIVRDTKGLYKKAFLPEGHADKISNLSGVNDTFDIPLHPDLHIRTDKKNTEACAGDLFRFIITQLAGTVFLTKRFMSNFLIHEQ